MNKDGISEMRVWASDLEGLQSYGTDDSYTVSRYITITLSFSGRLWSPTDCDCYPVPGISHKDQTNSCRESRGVSPSCLRWKELSSLFKKIDNFENSIKPDSIQVKKAVLRAV